MRDLWRSQITGRIRRGTRVSELRTLFEQNITVSSIQEPLCSCLADDLAQDTKRLMDDLDFDVIGYKTAEATPPHGLVQKQDLVQGVCSDFVTEFTARDLISDSMPLIDLLPALREADHKFVIEGAEVVGIVTRADLQKPPVRILMFGMITLLEMHLTFLVRYFYPEESWVEGISEGRLNAAKALVADRAERREELNISDCLQFCDKRELLVANKDARNALGFTSKSNGRTRLKAIEKLRDLVAHAQDLVSGSDWQTTVGAIQDAESLLERSEIIALRHEVRTPTNCQ